MNPSQAVLLVALTACLVSQGLGLTLPSILSSFTASRKSDDAESDKDQELKEQQEKYPTTHRPTRPPLIPAIPHPADTPLNPLTNPNHPLHPDNLPSLHLPSFPHFDRETIHATKTVFVEVTDRLTIHPVCMTAYKVTPPCLPFDPHHHHQVQHHPKDQKDRYEDNKLQEASVIKPTAVIELEPTRILGGETISEGSSLVEAAADHVEPAEIPVVEPSSEDARSGRYMELTPSIVSPEKVEIKDAPAEHQGSGGSGSHGTSPLHVVQNLLRRPVTHYRTKTLLVTKVEKVLDTRVTATLLAENCIPTNSHIPLCAPHGGLVGPGFHGYYDDGIYTETFGGHIVAGLHSEKRPGYTPEGNVHEEIHHEDKEINHQAKEEEQDDIDSENNEDEE